MTQDLDSLRIARERIAAEAVARTGSLDLSDLRLTALPTELSCLDHLQFLDCSRTQVSDLSPLARLTALQKLECSSTQVKDLSPLTGLAMLQELSCYHTQVNDLSPLAELTALQELDCSRTKVSDLLPLAGLTGLQKLECYETQVSDLSPLSSLTALQELYCHETPVSNLSPLAGLAMLQELHCFETQVSDLSPLAGLAALQKLDCSETPVSNLSPLAGLPMLQELHCCSTQQIKDLTPLSGLIALQKLDCSITQVNDLTPLSGLTALQELYCFETQVNDLTPLSALTALQELYCYETQVSDLSPLSGLTELQVLHCSETQVDDLSPLAELAALQELRFDNCCLNSVPYGLLNHSNLKYLFLNQTQIPGIPAGVLSQHTYDNCLGSLRSHLRALESGSVESTDTKLLILGNGRIGKTQICRQLRKEEYDSNVASTHGIMVSSVSLPQPENESPVLLHLWDFGGQDIYHGTHALFMRTRAIFMLVWIPKAEAASEYEHDGLIFRNQPLDYWLSYIRNLSGLDNPVLVVQARCDRPEDEIRHIPVPDHALEGFRFCKLLQHSSRENRGRAALNEALREAVAWLREEQGIVLLGKGWMRVKLRVEAMRNADAALPPEERRYRTLCQETFRQLCAEGKGDVDSPEYLLQYLHNSGIVFYQPGLFYEQIILDQGWVLEAIYTVFHREKCYKHLRYLRGRFYRSLLEDLIWEAYSEEEQKLFLDMMLSCGVCFIYQEGDEKCGIEPIYIAPDLLPNRAEVEMELAENWDSALPTEEVVFEYELHQPGLLRSFVSRIGNEAGVNALYWKGGISLYEHTCRSRALIEQEAQGGWRGVIRLQTQKGDAKSLLARLTQRLMKEQEQWGVRHLRSTSSLPLQRKLESKKAALAEQERQPLAFVQKPSAQPEYCVSYAWGDETEEGKAREDIVNKLCVEAEARGIQILRDKKDLDLGDSISRFMERIGQGNLVFVVLSDKYLKSPNCMFELSEIWRNSRQDEDDFLRRVRTYALPNTPIFSMSERVKCAAYWEEELEKLKPHLDFLGDKDLLQYRRIKSFSHNIGNILATIADRKMPSTFDELRQYGFSDLGL